MKTKMKNQLKKYKLLPIIKRIFYIINFLFIIRLKRIIKYPTRYYINFYNNKYSLIVFPYKNLTQEYIRKIVLDNSTIKDLNSWKYFYIFDNKGLLICVISWYVDNLFFEDMLVRDHEINHIYTTINYNCGQHILHTILWSFSNITFYMYISDEDIFNIFPKI